MTLPPLSRALLLLFLFIAILAVDCRLARCQSPLVTKKSLAEQIKLPAEIADEIPPAISFVEGLAGALLLCVAATALIFIAIVGKRISKRRSPAERDARALRLSRRVGRFIAKPMHEDQDTDRDVAKSFDEHDAAAREILESRRHSLAGKTVVIADDDLEMTQMLVMRFKQLGITAWRTPNAVQALVGVQQLKADLIILDVNMPTGNGLAVCEMLTSAEGLSNVPVIIYTGSSSEPTVRRCNALGARHVLKGPNSWKVIEQIVYELFCPREKTLGTQHHDPQVELRHAVRSANGSSPMMQAGPALRINSIEQPSSVHRDPPNMAPIADRHDLPTSETCGNAMEEQQSVLDRGPSARRPQVLVIDDDREMSMAIALRLSTFDVDVLSAFTGMDGYWRAVVAHPDVILCDMSMPDGDGNYVFGRLLSHSLTKDIPVIFITGQADPSLRRELMSRGAAACLIKPLNMKMLLDELRRHITFSHEPHLATFPVAAVQALSPAGDRELTVTNMCGSSHPTGPQSLRNRNRSRSKRRR